MSLIEQAVQDCYLCGALKGDPMIPACGVGDCPMQSTEPGATPTRPVAESQARATSEPRDCGVAPAPRCVGAGTLKIVTQDQYFRWVATTENYDGPGSPIGMGNTEQQAIDDLKEILADRAEQ